MTAPTVVPDSSGFPVRWFGGFAVVELPAGRNFLTTPVLAGELGAALDDGDAAGLIIDLSRPRADCCRRKKRPRRAPASQSR